MGLSHTGRGFVSLASVSIRDEREKERVEEDGLRRRYKDIRWSGDGDEWRECVSGQGD